MPRSETSRFGEEAGYLSDKRIVRLSRRAARDVYGHLMTILIPDFEALPAIVFWGLVEDGGWCTKLKRKCYGRTIANPIRLEFKG